MNFFIKFSGKPYVADRGMGSAPLERGVPAFDQSRGPAVQQTPISYGLYKKF